VRRLSRAACVLVLFVVARTASAFVCITTDDGGCVYWREGGATLRSLLGAPGRTLINGTISWDQNAVDAANEWNAAGAAFHFNVELGASSDPCGPAGPRHACHNTGPAGENPVFFASSFCGQDFGDIIAITNTCYERDSGAMLNAPLFVNSSVLWNAYDGPIRRVGQEVLYDIRRVLTHEFGHVLGLDHPDENGQQVEALMNSRVSRLDRLQPDDLDGIRSMYPVPAPAGSGGGCQVEPRPHASAAGGVPILAVVVAFLMRRCRAVGEYEDGRPVVRPPTR